MQTDDHDWIEAVRGWYERSYGAAGLNAQRRYPNEELCRFMGRNFFSVPFQNRAAIKVLETGCGSGANLWMLARENFDTYGIDISERSIFLARQMLDSYTCSAQLTIADMTQLPYADSYFDAVVDVFSSYCLNSELGKRYLAEVRRVLKRGGLFFSYFPAKSSDAFTRRGPATLIDVDTLSGIEREDSAYAGNHYPFRFLHPAEYVSLLALSGLEVGYNELISRTYRRGQESFSFLTIEARACR